MSYEIALRIDNPVNLAEMRPGRIVGCGLYQDWTYLAVRPTQRDNREGIFLAVRPHAHHPFVTLRFAFRPEDGEFVTWSGTYHATLGDAIADFEHR